MIAGGPVVVRDVASGVRGSVPVAEVREEQVPGLDHPRELAGHRGRGVALEHRLAVLRLRKRRLVNEDVASHRQRSDADAVARVPEQTQPSTGPVGPDDVGRVYPRPARRPHRLAVLESLVIPTRRQTHGGALIRVEPPSLVRLVDDVAEARHGVPKGCRANHDRALLPAPSPRILRAFPVHGPVRQLQSPVPCPLPRVAIAEIGRRGGSVIRPTLAEEHAAPGVRREVRLRGESARVRAVAGADARDAVAGRG